jgi:hypothetical protein
MGRVKEIMMDFENAEDFVMGVSNALDSEMFQKDMKNDTFRLNTYKNFLKLLNLDLKRSRAKFKTQIVDFVFKYLSPLMEDFEGYLKGEDSSKYLSSIISKFDYALDQYRYILISNIANADPKAINSETFYNQKIAELESKTNELQEALKITEGKSQDEIINAKKEVEEANRKILEYKNELEIKKKQEDAKENWKEIIKNTFNDLKTYLKPINDEQNRLKKLFWVYLVMSIVVVIAIFAIEAIEVCKIVSSKGFPALKEYITIYLPLPVAGALLWGFIYQMNRSQRQLVVIAKSIHKIEYVQGLLLSINKLAPSSEDGINRINLALDKLIKNHLEQKEIETEEDLIREEKKDSLPVETVIKLLKEIKGTVK